MFQFATFALQHYVFMLQWPYGRVSPFGNLRIKVCLLTPRSLSQATTSFIAWYRQGIHHVHLVTCPYNFSFWRLVSLLKPGSSPESGYSSLLLMSITLAFAVSQGIWFSKLLSLLTALFKLFLIHCLFRYNHNPSINYPAWLSSYWTTTSSDVILYRNNLIISTLLLLNC